MPGPALDASIISSYINFTGTLTASYYFSFLKNNFQTNRLRLQRFQSMHECTASAEKSWVWDAALLDFNVHSLSNKCSKKNGKFIIYWTFLCLALFWMLHFSISILTTIAWCDNDYKCTSQLNKGKIEKWSNLAQVIQWKNFLLTWVVWEDTMEEVSLLNFHWFGPTEAEGGFPGKENGVRKGAEVGKGTEISKNEHSSMAGVYRSSWPEVKIIIRKLSYCQELGQGVWTTYSGQQKVINSFEERGGWSRLFTNLLFVNLLYLAMLTS